MKAKKKVTKKPTEPLTLLQGSKEEQPKQVEVTLTEVQKQALCSIIRESEVVRRALEVKVELQTAIVDAILQEYGFSKEALMDLHRIDFDGVVTITEAKKGSKT